MAFTVLAFSFQENDSNPFSPVVAHTATILTPPFLQALGRVTLPCLPTVGGWIYPIPGCWAQPCDWLRPMRC